MKFHRGWKSLQFPPVLKSKLRSRFEKCESKKCWLQRKRANLHFRRIKICVVSREILVISREILRKHGLESSNLHPALMCLREKNDYGIMGRLRQLADDVSCAPAH